VRHIIRSPLKWAGGKSRLIERLRQHLPGGPKLVEPFVGSGVVFLNTDYDRYLLADINPDLINFFTVLKHEKSRFIDFASQWFSPSTNCAKAYYDLREAFNQTTDAKLRAALFLYLNRHGYNGLCRYNASGRFNVPFGRYARPYFPAREMELFALKAQRAEFVQEDFRKLGRRLRKGHHVYCDPPYVPLSATAYFTRYATQDFGPSCQQDLAKMAQSWASRGVRVVISNHDNAVTRSLYRDALIESFHVSRFISCQGARRQPVKELIARYEPIAETSAYKIRHI
jgi:DNA adenine methylase